MKKIIKYSIFLILFAAAVSLAYLSVLAIQEKELHFAMKVLIILLLLASELVLIVFAMITNAIVNDAFD